MSNLVEHLAATGLQGFLLLCHSTGDLALSFNGNFREEHETVCPYLACELGKSVIRPFSSFF
jgi:hypothetical protein